MVRWMLVTAFLCVLSGNCAAQERLTLMTEDSAPFGFLGADGELTGFSVEVVREMQKRIDSTTPIQMEKWTRCYGLITDDRNADVAVFPMAFTEERRGLFHWVGPIAQTAWQFFARASDDIVIRSLEDAKKVESVGTYAGDYREKFLREQGFTNLDSTNSSPLNAHKLMKGRIRLWVVSDVGAKGKMEKEGYVFTQIRPVYTIDETGLYVAFHKNTSPDVVEAWRRAYEEVRKDGTLAELSVKWGVAYPTYVMPSAP